MIGVAGQNLLRPVNLLQKHDSCKHVRPGLHTQAHYQPGPGPDVVIQAFGTADHKLDIGPAGVLEFFKCFGKFEASEILAALIQDNDEQSFFEKRFYFCQFIGFHRRGIRMAALNLMNLQRPVQAFCVFLTQIEKRPFFQAANGDDFKAHNEKERARSGVGAACRMGGRTEGAPHFFYVVESPDFVAEEVDHDITRIQHHPVGGCQPFDPDVL